MPGPTDPIDNSMPAEDSFLELLAETLENLDRPARGQFLQRFFKTVAHLDLTEAASLDDWDQILNRQRGIGRGHGQARLAQARDHGCSGFFQLFARAGVDRI